MKTLLRERQLKYIDVEEMRVVTNDKHIAEQIKNDSTLSMKGNLLHSKVENVVMNGSKVGELKKVVKEQNLKSTVMNGVKSGKLGKQQNLKSIVMNARYLKRERQWGQMFEYRKLAEELTVFTDSADLGTKPLSKTVIAKHCLTLGYAKMDEENVYG